MWYAGCALSLAHTHTHICSIFSQLMPGCCHFDRRDKLKVFALTFIRLSLVKLSASFYVCVCVRVMLHAPRLQPTQFDKLSVTTPNND